MELLFLFVLFSMIMETESGGKVWLKLISFSNSRGKGANNHYCDGKYFFRGSDCDHRFILCLDTINGPQNTDTCGYGRVSTSPIHNRNSFTFGNRIGSTANPMTFSFSKWTGSCKLKIDIYDHDDNDDDYVDFMATYFFKYIPDFNETTAIAVTRNMKHRVSMSLQLKVFCDSNYYGPRCDIICEPCEKYTCDKMGTKVCLAGWTGRDCNVKKDACSSGPCLNDGTCHNSLGSYLCVCKPGFNGNNCEQDIDECASLPCSNNGTCIDLINTYQCTCPYGYSGLDCSTVYDLCLQNPCLNNSTCKMDPNDVKFKCTCVEGWTGSLCTTDIDECLNDVCSNNGTCENTPGGFQCFCTDGWHGDTCQTDVNECLTTDCFGNNSTCINTNGSFYCSCQSGFTGLLCDIDIDECSSSPCLNGGICHDKVDGFSCECAIGYSGELCKTEIDECADQRDKLNLYIDGKITDADRENLMTDIKGVIYKYMESRVKDVSIDYSTDWLEDNSGNMISNVTLTLELNGMKLCGIDNIKELKELLLQEQQELSHKIFHGDVTAYRRPEAVVERQKMTKQSWLENNWYLVMVAVGLLILVTVVVSVLHCKKRRKQRSLSNGSITNNVRWHPDLGAMNTLPSLSFDNDLYQTALSNNQTTFSSQQTTEYENFSEEQPIRGPLAFDNNTYQKAIPNEQLSFLNSNDFILDDNLH